MNCPYCNTHLKEIRRGTDECTDCPIHYQIITLNVKTIIYNIITFKVNDIIVKNWVNIQTKQGTTYIQPTDPDFKLYPEIKLPLLSINFKDLSALEKQLKIYLTFS